MSKECSSHSYREAVDMGFTALSCDEALAALAIDDSWSRVRERQVRSVLGRLALDWPGTGGLAESID